MKTYTTAAIARRARATVTSARKVFEGYRLGGDRDCFVKALSKLNRVEDDVRYLDNQDEARAAISAARAAIRAAWEAAEKTALLRNEVELDAINARIAEARRAEFASRCNWNLSGGR